MIPFLEHSDPNVQFFGAHTIQVKITRDWSVLASNQVLRHLVLSRDSFPQDHAEELKMLVLNLTARSVALGRSKIMLRKLFVAVRLFPAWLLDLRPTPASCPLSLSSLRLVAGLSG